MPDLAYPISFCLIYEIYKQRAIEVGVLSVKSYGLNHELIDRYGLGVSPMAMDMFRWS